MNQPILETAHKWQGQLPKANNQQGDIERTVSAGGIQEMDVAFEAVLDVLVDPNTY